MSKRKTKTRTSSVARSVARRDEESAGISAPPAWLVACVLAGSIAIVYFRAVHVPFIFDDAESVTRNTSITRIWPLIGTAELPGPLNPLPELPTSGRPLVNLSFALNYCFGELSPVSYHAVNMALHAFSAMLVWAIVRRTLRLPFFAGRFDASSGWQALGVAMLWALHPLQTETVVYVTQRTELMVAFFYLATLYCSLRYWEPTIASVGHEKSEEAEGESRIGGWQAVWLTLAIVACSCGMLSKEVMVSAPIIVLLFDRTFIAGSLKEALRRSWPLYAGLAATWVVLLVANIGAPRGETAGFSHGVSAFDWWLTQANVLLMYFKLVVWPSPLLLHYDFPYLSTFRESWFYVVPLVLLAAVILVLLWLNRPAGFLGAFLFAILLPTLVVPIVTEIAAERRMYLPLLVPVILFVVGGYTLARAMSKRLGGSGLAISTAVAIVVLLTFACGASSAKRLADYNDEMLLWRQVVQYQPQNYRAHNNLGNLLLRMNKLPEAIDELNLALATKPNHYPSMNNLGIALDHSGKYQDAVEVFKRCLELKPDYIDAMQNLGNSLRMLGHLPEARKVLEEALKLKPGDAGIHSNLGVVMASSDELPQAIEHFRTAVRLDPQYAPAHINLGKSLSTTGDTQGAISELGYAIHLQPNRPDLHNDLGAALGKAQQYDAAIEQFQIAMRLDPRFALAYNNLAMTLAMVNRSTEALAASQRAIEVARATGQTELAKSAEEWLARYREELIRIGAQSK